MSQSERDRMRGLLECMQRDLLVRGYKSIVRTVQNRDGTIDGEIRIAKRRDRKVRRMLFEIGSTMTPCEPQLTQYDPETGKGWKTSIMVKADDSDNPDDYKSKGRAKGFGWQTNYNNHFGVAGSIALQVNDKVQKGSVKNVTEVVVRLWSRGTAPWTEAKDDRPTPKRTY